MDAQAAKRVVGGLSMLLAPVLLLVGFAIHPPEPKSGAEAVEVILAGPARWNAAHLLFSVGIVLSIPAVSGLMRLLDDRGAWFALVGGLLSAIGVLFLGVFLGVELAMSAIAIAPAGQHNGQEAALRALIDLGGPLPVVFLGLGLNLGLVVWRRDCSLPASYRGGRAW